MKVSHGVTLNCCIVSQTLYKTQLKELNEDLVDSYKDKFYYPVQLKDYQNMVEIISDDDSLIKGDVIQVGRSDEAIKERELIERIDNLRYRKKMEEDIKKRR